MRNSADRSIRSMFVFRWASTQTWILTEDVRHNNTSSPSRDICKHLGWTSCMSQGETWIWPGKVRHRYWTWHRPIAACAPMNGLWKHTHFRWSVYCFHVISENWHFITVVQANDEDAGSMLWIVHLEYTLTWKCEITNKCLFIGTHEVLCPAQQAHWQSGNERRHSTFICSLFLYFEGVFYNINAIFRNKGYCRLAGFVRDLHNTPQQQHSR